MKLSIVKFCVYLSFLVLVVLGVSCIKDSYNEDVTKEDMVLDDFFKSSKGFTEVSLGYYYKTINAGTGISPKAGEMVIMNYNSRIIETKRLYDTTDSLEAENNYITSSVVSKIPGPLKISIFTDYGFYSRGVCDRLLSMKEGQTDSIVCKGSVGIGSYIPTVFKVTLLKVISNPREYEKEQISKYLTTNFPGKTLADTTGAGGTNAVSDSIGIYLLKDTVCTGDYAVNTDSVDIKYTLKLLPYTDTYLHIPEKTIESSTIKIKLGTTGLISGFVGAVRLMREKERATVIMPYHKAYGLNYTKSGKQILLPECSTLIYEMEITRIKKNS